MSLVTRSALLSCLAVAGGCSAQGNEAGRAPAVPGELRAVNVRSVQVRPTTVADSMLLKSPTGLGVSATHVILGDRGADSLLRVFDAATHQYVGTVGDSRTGQGRSFRAGFVEPIRGGDDIFRIFDPVLEQTYAVGVGRAHAVRQIQALDGNASIMQPMYLRDGRFISTALRINGRFGVFDPSGRLIATRGPLPPGVDTLPVFIRQHAYSARTVLHPDERRLAVATRYADHLDIYDTTGVRIAQAPRVVGFEPVYDVGVRGGAPALGMRDDSRIGYVAVTADSARIYALYSGRTIGSFGERAYRGRLVYVFTWNGILEHALEFDTDVANIAVAPDGTRLYAVTPARDARLLAVTLGETRSADARSTSSGERK